jgi:uncharacterized protein YprB with RNaseH-like and TPR domain
LAWVWGKYEQNTLGDMVKERQIISVAWKWLHEDEIHVLALPMLKSYKRRPEDNSGIVRKLLKLFNEADITVGHNVDSFDDKMVNTEIVKLPPYLPPKPHLTIDTLKIARTRFRFNSNKLSDLGKLLKLGDKVHHWGFELWVRCMKGDPKAWDLMMRYNKGDVRLLEKVYLRLRPWMKKHPDMNIKDNHVGCQTCKGTKMMPRGWAMNKGAIKKRRYVCADCGSWATVTLGRKQLRYVQGS